MKQIKENIENATLGCRLGRAYQIMLGQLAVALDKLTLLTAYEERALDVHGQVINVCAAYKWLLV